MMQYGEEEKEGEGEHKEKEEEERRWRRICRMRFS